MSFVEVAHVVIVVLVIVEAALVVRRAGSNLFDVRVILIQPQSCNHFRYLLRSSCWFARLPFCLFD